MINKEKLKAFGKEVVDTVVFVVVLVAVMI